MALLSANGLHIICDAIDSDLGGGAVLMCTASLGVDAPKDRLLNYARTQGWYVLGSHHLCPRHVAEVLSC